jgi:hypothetical protein
VAALASAKLLPRACGRATPAPSPAHLPMVGVKRSPRRLCPSLSPVKNKPVRVTPPSTPPRSLPTTPLILRADVAQPRSLMIVRGDGGRLFGIAARLARVSEVSARLVVAARRVFRVVLRVMKRTKRLPHSDSEDHINGLCRSVPFCVYAAPGRDQCKGESFHVLHSN